MSFSEASAGIVHISVAVWNVMLTDSNSSGEAGLRSSGIQLQDSGTMTTANACNYVAKNE